MNTRISARAALLAMLLALAACGGGGGGGASPPDDNGGNNGGDNGGDNGGNDGGDNGGDTGDTLTLRGSAPPTPGGVDVVLRAGDARYEVAADAAGSFEIEIPVEDIEGNPLLVLDLADRANPDLRFSALLDEYEFAVSAAGDDKVVDVSELRALRVRPIDIAMYAGVFEANGHLAPATRQQAAELERDKVDMEALFKGASLVDMWADGAVPVPTDTWELLTDRNALLEYVKSGGAQQGESKPAVGAKLMVADGEDWETQLNGSILALLSDREPFTTDTLASRYLIGEVSRSTGELKGFEVILDEGGTGTLVSAAGRSAMSWTLDDEGFVTMVPDETAVITLSEAPDHLPEPRIVTYTIKRIIAERMRAGRFSDLIWLTVEYEEMSSTAVDNELYPLERDFTRFAVAVKDDGNPQLAAEDMHGDWVITALSVNSDIGSYVDETMFDHQVVNGHDLHLLHDWTVHFDENGTGSIVESSDTFNWTIDGQGRVELTFADGVVLRMTAVRRGEPMMDFYIEALMPDSSVVGNGAYALRLPQTRPALDPDAMHGYHARFGVDDNNVTSWGVLRHTIPLLPGSIADVLRDFARTYVEDALQWFPQNANRRWYVGQEGNLHIDLVRLNPAPDSAEPGSFEPWCAAQVEGEYCYVSESYELQPLLQDGRRTYYLETFRYNAGTEMQGGEPIVNENGHRVYAPLSIRTFLTWREQLTPEEAAPAPDITQPMQ